jgi:hypothetical protein
MYAAKTGSHPLATLVDRSTLSLFLHHPPGKVFNDSKNNPLNMNVMKKKFNPEDWLTDTTNFDKSSICAGNSSPNLGEVAGRQPGRRGIGKNTSQNPFKEVSQILHQLESRYLDLTANYADWRNIGFAFADEFGESGRELFHRVSQFHPEYKTTECDKQFDACLKAKGHGITLKTFFHLAKQCGINLRTSPIRSSNSFPDSGEVDRRQTGRRGLETQPDTLPTFPKSLFPQLPGFLQKVLQVSDSNEERDIMLLGTLVTLSACLPKIYGIYDGKRVYPNLYLFISAQASAGKGRLVHCKQLVKPVHKALREQARLIKIQYEADLAEYSSKKGKEEGVEKPEQPKEKMLFIPANNSTTGVFQLLSDNNGKGLIFETEGDTLAQAFKSDYGNYSDGFRKAFHHETISYYRRTDREYVDIEQPCLSTVLSGTPKQISSLIPNAENGLFSRFIFYFMNVQPVWKNVFASSASNGLDDHFNNLGKEFYELYTSLDASSEMEFSFSPEQQQKFNSFFADIQTRYITIQGLDYMATVRRLGLVAFRMAMILTVLRIPETGEWPEHILCNNTDFNVVLTIIKTLVKHSSRVFSELPEDNQPPKRKNRKEKFLENLPLHFNRQKYLDVAKSLSIPDKTAEGYITEFVKKALIHRESQDKYINSLENEPNSGEENK